MRGEVINFEILRIESELEKYDETGILPLIILDGVYSLEDICTIHYDNLSKKHQKIADDLKSNYHTSLTKCVTSLRLSLKKEYAYVMNNLATSHESFRFRSVMKKYRSQINPIKALYYELREVRRRYSSENEHHVWLVDLLADKHYKNIIIDSLEKDIKRLERVVRQFYIPIVKNSVSVPLELFHAKQTINDFKHFHQTFSDFDSDLFE
jgi:hypothetical protein